MSRKEYEEVKWISLEMKASSQTELLTPTPIAMDGPTEEVIVAQKSAHAPTVPYAVVEQQQPLRNQKKIEEV